MRPTKTREGAWHHVQFDLERVYCGEPPGDMFRAILAAPRRGSENQRAGALFTELYAGGDASGGVEWLRAQLDGEFQGGEQGGGYTNYYRADVLAALRWASERGDARLAQLARAWLARSYALDVVHTVPGRYEVVVPCARNKLYNRDGRAMALRLLAGDADPRAVLGERRWQYPAYDDVRWLADAILAGRIAVDGDVAGWAVRRDRAALTRVLAKLDGMRLRSPLRWVLLDSGAWYSFAPGGVEAYSHPVDAVAADAGGAVTEMPRGRPREGVSIEEKRGRLVARLADGETTLPLPAGRPVLTVDIGRG